MANYSVGIVGLGNFGKFLVALVPSRARIYGFDTSKNKNMIPRRVEITDLATVAKTDVLIIAVPLSGYRDLLKELRCLVSQNTLIIDICSVKLLPDRLFDEYLPGHQNLLLTHPLFGPRFTPRGIKGQKLVVTKSIGQKAKQILDFCTQNLGLEVVRMKAKEHVKIMATVHVLPYFLGRSLANMNIKKQTVTLPSYKKILDFVDFDKSHSAELYATILQGNPYASEARKMLMESMKEVDNKLNQDTSTIK